MNTKAIALLIVVILVVAVVMIVPIGTPDVVDSPFGQWKVGIRAVGKDGSVTPLSIVNTVGGQLLSVANEGIEIESLEFFISAKATGEGYTQCEIDMTDVKFTPYILDGCPFDSKYGDKVTIDVGASSFTEIYTYTLTAEQIECDALDLGTHTLIFESTGTVRYRGLPDGDVKTITSIPSAETQITISEPEGKRTVYKCEDGELITRELDAGESTPSGWSDEPLECSCYTDTKYDTWSSWKNGGCVKDCKRTQSRTRKVYEATICPEDTGNPDWHYVKTETDYRTITDSSCCEAVTVNCYQCDGSGGVTMKQFDNSCPSGWYYSAPDCDCDTTITHSAWSSWKFDHCVGSMRWDKRTRTKTTTESCPGGSPSSTTETETEWKHFIDNRVCSIFQIVKVSPTFTVIGAVAQGSYYMDSEHYLGTRD